MVTTSSTRPDLPRERLALVMFRVLSPPLPRLPKPEPPPELAPAERVALPRRHAGGTLDATWYPAPGAARGTVLLLPPWTPWGRAYFHRRGRIEALRAAGFAALALDFPGFGASARPAGLYDRDVEDALDALPALAPQGPLHVWGVSAGGYWAHPVLARRNGVEAAFFEDVSAHLFEWSRRMRPRYRAFFRLFRWLFPEVHRYLDIRRHADQLTVARCAYAAGADDPGIPSAESRELSGRAGGALLLVEGAGHLAAIKRATAEVLELALRTLGGDDAG